MQAKIIALLFFVSAASAGVAPVAYAGAPALTYAAPVAKLGLPVAKAVAAISPEPFDPNPQYTYGYSVQDTLTGDAKGHQETRNGDVVQGQYSLVEPDGSVRTVTYTADDLNGFNAVVDRQSAGVVHKTAAVAPVAVAHAAPVVKAVAGPAVVGRALLG
ncbi:Larval cuticle protein A2B [Orchesella cincta]|uniref:Larval cuticle protein A2B n=1 Tax=Orchesella cincta TaxID=48709 RepID=A0A1D2NLY6_ORCCI|nr:Larval cuticle protein A2B [Orchesella cincta]